MASLSLGQAARLTGLDKFNMPSLADITSRWHSGSRSKNGACRSEPVAAAESAPSRLQALVPWHGRLADLRLMLAEERITELKSALDDMRAQRDAWQAIAQARIRPARKGASWSQWLLPKKTSENGAAS
jgi:hypothetical protein